MKAGTKLLGAITVAAGLAFYGPASHTAATLLSAVTPPASAVPANAPANVKLAGHQAAKYGWTGGQFSCLYTLWQGESNWSQYADSETTGLTAPGAPFAYGIPQAYPGTKMPLAAQPASAGGSSDPATQIAWGLGYIEQTYGSPCSALAAKRANGNQGY